MTAALVTPAATQQWELGFAFSRRAAADEQQQQQQTQSLGAAFFKCPHQTLECFHNVAAQDSCKCLCRAESRAQSPDVFPCDSRRAVRINIAEEGVWPFFSLGEQTVAWLFQGSSCLPVLTDHAGLRLGRSAGI